jgi:hypothetical protein
MIEDHPIADISVEQVDIDIESSIVVYVVIVDKDHPSPMDSEECALEVGIVVQDIDEEDKEVLPLENHKDIMEEDYYQLYRQWMVEEIGKNGIGAGLRGKHAWHGRSTRIWEEEMDWIAKNWPLLTLMMNSTNKYQRRP